MVERKNNDKMEARVAFVEANAELLERCTTIPSKERKGHIRELVAKARAYFGYSEKTIAQDIVRPLIRAYSKYVAMRQSAEERREGERTPVYSGQGMASVRGNEEDRSTHWDR